MRGRWLVLAALAALALTAGLMLGAVRLPPSTVWSGLTDGGSSTAAIVRQLRLPRVLLGFRTCWGFPGARRSPPS